VAPPPAGRLRTFINMNSQLLTRIKIAAVILATAAAWTLCAATASITVDADKPGHSISPMLYGIFFEEINCSGDGGIYPELVRNRSFEDGDKAEFWALATSGSAKGEMKLDSSRPLNPANRQSLRLHVSEAADGAVSVVNEGYWGISVTAGATYHFSLAARCDDGFNGPLSVAIEGKNGKECARGSIDGLTKEWKLFNLTLTATGTDASARLSIGASRPGTVWLDMVSLFPKKTWKDRPNGLRPDLAEMLAGLRPAFVRFPGGCWVEGDELKTSYRWKETIGDVSQRRNQWNIWQYYSTQGLGYLEYLILCEDLRAEPLFVINCGMSHRENVPMDQMGQLVQDALDAIEYANGPVESVWGGLRARHGHPAPFQLKYMEIGNENGGPAYHERYALFHDAIKARYPQIHLVANEWSGVPKSRPLEIVDEHYYSSPEFFISQAHKYDSYDRKGHKVYVGEYAVTAGCGQGNLIAALGEAAFMTGMERNSDVVVMASYAPLFANVNYKKWNPDLINFDGSRVYGLPSYYVQQMFAENRGDAVLPLEATAGPAAQPEPVRGGIGLGTWSTQAEYKDVRVTQGDKVLYESKFQEGAADWHPVRGNWQVKDGAFQQTANEPDQRATAGDASWTNYTYSLKARKLGGAEGFLVLFQVRSNEEWAWWNLGGWGNTRHAIERGSKGGKGIVGNEVPGQIETGRWYDLRVEVTGAGARCFLDGKLVHDVKYPEVTPLHAVASRVNGTGEVILKVVNVSKEDLDTTVRLRGVRKVEPVGKAITLTSSDPQAENSISEPLKVAPRTATFDNAAGTFRHTFPAYSVSILRLKATTK